MNNHKGRPVSRTPAMLRGLHDLCRRIGGTEKTLIELGVYQGDSTAVFAEHFGAVLAVDPWDRLAELVDLVGTDGECRLSLLGLHFEDRATADAEWKKWQEGFVDAERTALERFARLGNVIAVKAFDHELVSLVQPVSGVYIDAIHTYDEVSRQIEQWLPMCREFIAGHDYNQHYWPGVVRAVNERFEDVQVFRDTSWLARLS